MEISTIEQADKFVRLGRIFGYSECCIVWVVSHMDWRVSSADGWDFSKAKKIDGYVPCPKCSAREREVLIELISRRRLVKAPFPIADNSSLFSVSLNRKEEEEVKSMSTQVVAIISGISEL